VTFTEIPEDYKRGSSQAYSILATFSSSHLEWPEFVDKRLQFLSRVSLPLGGILQPAVASGHKSTVRAVSTRLSKQVSF